MKLTLNQFLKSAKDHANKRMNYSMNPIAWDVIYYTFIRRNNKKLQL